MRSTLLLAASCAMLAAGQASATVITFDDTGPVDSLASYQGFTWTNIGVTTGSVPKSGFVNGVKSGANVAYTYTDRTAVISAGTAFTLNDAWFTGGWRDALPITAIGYNGNTRLYSTNFLVDSTAPTLATFNWTGLTRVTLTAGAGKRVPGIFGGNQIAIDNVRVNEAVTAVPEPATWGLMTLGLGLTGATLRRRRRLPVPA